jgi:hypothetical protein
MASNGTFVDPDSGRFPHPPLKRLSKAREGTTGHVLPGGYGLDLAAGQEAEERGLLTPDLPVSA